MNLSEIKKKAKAMGIKPGKLKKKELVREIQNKEATFPCFATATDYCDRLDCCFRTDCLDKNY